jgi:hypothetical protein
VEQLTEATSHSNAERNHVPSSVSHLQIRSDLHGDNDHRGSLIRHESHFNNLADSLKLIASGTAKLASSTAAVVTGADPKERFTDTFKTIATGANKLAGTAVGTTNLLATKVVNLVAGGDDGK